MCVFFEDEDDNVLRLFLLCECIFCRQFNQHHNIESKSNF